MAFGEEGKAWKQKHWGEELDGRTVELYRLTNAGRRVLRRPTTAPRSRACTCRSRRAACRCGARLSRWPATWNTRRSWVPRWVAVANRIRARSSRSTASLFQWRLWDGPPSAWRRWRGRIARCGAPSRAPARGTRAARFRHMSPRGWGLPGRVEVGRLHAHATMLGIRGLVATTVTRHDRQPNCTQLLEPRRPWLGRRARSRADAGGRRGLPRRRSRRSRRVGCRAVAGTALFPQAKTDRARPGACGRDAARRSQLGGARQGRALRPTWRGTSYIPARAHLWQTNAPGRAGFTGQFPRRFLWWAKARACNAGFCLEDAGLPQCDQHYPPGAAGDPCSPDRCSPHRMLHRFSVGEPSRGCLLGLDRYTRWPLSSFMRAFTSSWWASV